MAAGHPVVIARFAMFEFVFIEVSLLLTRSARSAGDGGNIADYFILSSTFSKKIIVVFVKLGSRR